MTEDELRDLHERLFSAAWCLAWQQLSQQRDALRVLFNAAKKADGEIPRFRNINLNEMTGEEQVELSAYIDASSAARGTREAYATAVVMFFDSQLKEVTKLYRRIPGVDRNLKVHVEGIDIATIFAHAANNVRHHNDWRVPAKYLSNPRAAVANATTIATLMGKPAPTVDTVSLWAGNWAWPIIQRTCSHGTFDDLLAVIVAAMNELMTNAVRVEHEYVTLYREKYPIP